MKLTYQWQTKPVHDDEIRIKEVIERAFADGKIRRCGCGEASATIATDSLGPHFGVLVKCKCGKVNTRFSGQTQRT